MITFSGALAISDSPSVADLACLESRLDSYNLERTGIFDARSLAILLKRPDGEIYAGLCGHTWGGCCEIKIIWVSEQERGHGLGRSLLHSAEGEARSRGCGQIILSTHGFQAQGFYEKEGFERIAAIADYPSGHDHILMLKRLAGKSNAADAFNMRTRSL